MAKYFQVKVYNQNNDYLTTWTDIVSNIMFSNEINSAGGQMTFKLARNAGDYGEGSDIDFGHKVKVYVFDKELPNGNLIFQGFISAYTPIYKDDSVDIMLLSYGAELADYMIEGGESLESSQSNSTISWSFGNDFSSSNTRHLAQTFTATSTHKLSRLEVYAATSTGYSQDTGTFVERFNIGLYAKVFTGATPESGTLIGTSAVTNILDGTMAKYSLIFSPTVSINNSSTYNIVFYPTSYTTQSDFYTLMLGVGSGYSGGVMHVYTN
jgi:hypothetical protein